MPSILLLAAPVALVACGTGTSPDAAGPSPVPLGGIASQPGEDGLLNGAAYVVEANQGGGADQPRLVSMAWGRLVDVYDTVPTSAAYAVDPLDPGNYSSRLVFTDLVVGENVDTAYEAGQLKWELSVNPVNGRTSLRVGANVEADGKLFALRIAEAEQGLDPVDPKGLGPTELPPYSLVARNAALTVRFDDLLDESTIGLHSTVKVFAGDPPVVPFDVRVVPDQVHGAVSTFDGAFHPTRLIVDFTISSQEVASFPTIVQANGIGLPASIDSSSPNVAIAFPTVKAPSLLQHHLLTNVSGSPLSAEDSGAVDYASPTVDVVWALRAGNADDQNNGFLVDLEQPRVVGVQPVELLAASDDPGGIAGRDFLLSYRYLTEVCATDPVPGDVLQVTAALQLEVQAPGTAVGGTALGVAVSVVSELEGVVATDLVGGVVEYQTPWRTSLGPALAPCFVRFSPSAGQPPNLGVDPDAQVMVRFSEPVDPASARPYDSFYVAREPGVDATLAESTPGSPVVAPAPDDLILGEILTSTDSREVRFRPLLPMTHEAGKSESYWFNLVSDTEAGGVTDLAGNPAAVSLPRIEFALDPNEPDADTGGWALRFNSTDEDGIAGPEVRGQVTFDTTDGRLRPRPVQRFSTAVDESQPMVSAMQPIGGLQTPFSSQGSKAHLMWRYMDMGLEVSQTDDLFYNLDIEGLALSPTDGNVSSTTYDKFEIRLGHGARLPDTVLDDLFVPKYPGSGLVEKATFAANYLDDSSAGPVVVHDRELGFAIANSGVFKAISGRSMLQMPWNVGLEEDDKSFYTWRDTAIVGRGNLNNTGGLVGAGVPTEQEQLIFSLTTPAGDVWGKSIPDADGTMTPVGLPTPALPLLMEYRCYPTEGSSLNNFDVSLGLSGWSQPYFRAFSTGGLDESQTVVQKNPDLESKPTGGFNGNLQQGPIGAPVPAQDPSVYMGQVDIVVRTSRAHTILVDAEQLPTSAFTPKAYDYAALSVEPSAAEQPAGTAVLFAWRGDASPSLDPELTAMLDAGRLDVFGEPLAGPLSSGEAVNRVHPWADPTWHGSLAEVSGYRFVQTRITFVGSTASFQTPSLDAYGLAFYR